MVLFCFFPFSLTAGFTGHISKAEHLPALPLQLDSLDYEFSRKFVDHVNHPVVWTFTPPDTVVPGRGLC